MSTVKKTLVFASPVAGIFTVLPAVFLSFLLASCETTNNEKDIGMLLKHFGDKGVRIQTVTPLNADIPHAEMGVAAKIAGREIGLYKYDTNKTKGGEHLKMIKDKGEMCILGKSFTSMVNGSFVMIDYEKNPERDKIVEAFESF